jgi:hypothetical protein
MRVLKLTCVILAMATSPLFAQQPYTPDPNACPATSALVCGFDGCICKCPDGSNAVLTPPGPACRIPNPPPLPSAVQPIPQASGAVTPPQSTPGARPPRIRTPMLKPKPQSPGGPVSTPQ